MAKKLKNPDKKMESNNKPNSKDASNLSSVFNTLFGEIPQHDSSFTSLFSENNPFRRKHEVGSGTEAKKAENEDANDHSDSSQLKEQKKRKKERLQDEKSNFDTEIVDESKKLKMVGLEGNENSNLGIVSTDASRNGDFSGEKLKKKKKSMKRKIDDVETAYEASRYGVKDGKEENKVGINTVLGEKRKKMDDPEMFAVPKEGFDDESKLLRTVFVGNLPLNIKKKVLLKEFEKFGEVESVRIRSVPIVDGKIPRKGAVIKKQFNENGDSVHGYIVFKTDESAQASLSHNMAVVAGNHIRVDRACPPRKKWKGDGSSTLYDSKRTVFLGNLPFDVKDEEVYQLFSGIKNLESSLEAVRVIRDPGSSVGKGIAYVLFKTMDAAKLVVTKRNLKLRNRELRLSHAKADITPSKRKDHSPPGPKNSHPRKKFASDTKTLESGEKMKAKSDLSYQGMRASKSGAQKKVYTRISTPSKSNSKTATEHNSAKQKRPAVAARKEKALQAARKEAQQAASGSKQIGAKRKFSKRTPESSGQKKKARKFR